jgi:Tol biopolymer transport system component
MPFAVAPDGRSLAFAAVGDDGAKRVWIRALDSVKGQPVAGSEIAGSTGPGLFWSPDGRFLAFASKGKLYKIDRAGGVPQLICDSPHRVFMGGSWSSNNVLVFSTRTGLWRVSASGGAAPSPLTEVDRSRGEVAHSFPTFLPNQRHFIYLRR